jgi:multiple antibiotic resistance protein
MTIDAGAISVAITVGAFHAQSLKHTVIQLLADVIGAAVVALAILVTYHYAHRVSSKIGHTGMMVLLRLSAFIMLCIGVGIGWSGIKSLLAEIGIPG